MDEHYISSNTVRIYNIIPFMGYIGDLLSASWFRSSLVNVHTLHELFSKMDRIEFPASLLSEVDAFLFDRRDSEIDRQHAGAILSSKMYQVVVGTYKIQRGMTMLLKDFADTCTLLIIRSFIARQMASRSISYASKHIVKTTESTGFFSSLRLLFTSIPGFRDVEGLRLPDQRLLTSFASKVMLDTPENELVRRFLLDSEKSPTVVFETVATNHHIDYRKIPECKEYIYDPPNRGYCYSKCMQKINASTSMGAYPALGDVRKELADKELEDSPIVIDNGHATVQLTTYDVCEHLMYNKCYQEQPESPVYDCADYFDEYYYHKTTENTNYDKTVACTKHLKGKLYNVAAFPFNDQLHWKNRPWRTEHWIVFMDGNRRILPHLGANNTYSFDKNLLCWSCTKNLNGHVYADVGVDLPIRYLPGFIFSVLQNLRATEAYERYEVFVKVQNFKAILESGRAADLLHELKHNWKVIKHPSFAANEVVATNAPVPAGMSLLPKFKPLPAAPAVPAAPEPQQTKRKVHFEEPNVSYASEDVIEDIIEQAKDLPPRDNSAPTAPPAEDDSGSDASESEEEDYTPTVHELQANYDADKEESDIEIVFTDSEEVPEVGAQHDTSVHTGNVLKGDYHITYELSHGKLYDHLDSSCIIVNPGSPNCPGGGYQKHSAALEEYLCNNSNLIEHIDHEQGKLIDPNDVRNFYAKKHSLYEAAHCLISRDVYTKDGKRHDVITAIAPNLDNPVVGKWSGQKLQDIWRFKWLNILSAADRTGKETLILPAIGCGVFKNDVKKVFGILRYVLQAVRFRTLRRVVLALPSAQHYKAVEKLTPRQVAVLSQYIDNKPCGREFKLQAPEWLHDVNYDGPQREFRASADHYGPLSNFAKTAITISGKHYPNGESAYQCNKSVNRLEKDVNARKICDAAHAAKIVKCCDAHAVILMAHIIDQKVEKHERVAKLLKPGDYYVENTAHTFWGKGTDRKVGLNMLGRLWTMKAAATKPTVAKVKEIVTINKDDTQTTDKKPEFGDKTYFDARGHPELQAFYKSPQAVKGPKDAMLAAIYDRDVTPDVLKTHDGPFAIKAMDYTPQQQQEAATRGELYISELHDAGPLGKSTAPYILRSDIPNLAGYHDIAWFNTKKQFVDYNFCKCLEQLPFHGVAMEVADNVVKGPAFDVPSPDFEANKITFPKDVSDIAKLALELKRDKSKKFAKIHNQCGQLLADTLPKKITEKEVHFVEGTYGSGKTHYMKQAILEKHTLPPQANKPETFIVITPNGALANEYKQAGFPAYSWSTGMIAAAGAKEGQLYDIYLDEVFLMDPRLLRYFALYSNALYAIGDRHQMHFGSKEVHSNYPNLAALVDHQPDRKSVV